MGWPRISYIFRRVRELGLRETIVRLKRRLRARLATRGASYYPPPAIPMLPADMVISDLPILPPLGRPLVSVIMAVRDRPDMVADAVQSVLAQSYRRWELLIVDDGGAKDSLASLQSFLSDPRVRIFRRPALGVSAARNHGLAQARGALIGYLDSDNIWYPDFLRAAVAAFSWRPWLMSLYGAIDRAETALGRLPPRLSPFDRAQLETENFIDLNAYVHRRELYDRLGGFDAELTRLVDWDLILRYTAAAAPVPLRRLAVGYRAGNWPRITTTVPIEANWLKIRRRWPPRLGRPLRVLYVVWHYPQLTESYIETEIRCVRRWGVHVEVWSETLPAAPYSTDLTIHRGSLEAAIAAARPDLLHVHWANKAIDYLGAIAPPGLPMTVRGHGFEISPTLLRKLDAAQNVARVYLFPHMMPLRSDRPIFRAMSAAFDSTLFKRADAKERRLVLRTVAGLPTKEIDLFIRVAKRLPDFRFVLVMGTCALREEWVGNFMAVNETLGKPVEILVDLQREEIAALLMARAAIYFHTIDPAGPPIGMPISIAEAMATGAYPLVRDVAPLRDYIGPAGACYTDEEDAVAKIAATRSWSDTDWAAAAGRSIDQAFAAYADERVFRPLVIDWQRIAAASRR